MKSTICDLMFSGSRYRCNGGVLDVPQLTLRTSVKNNNNNNKNVSQRTLRTVYAA